MTRSGSMRTLRGFETFITQTGPMARHVEDLWLGLQVLTDTSDGNVPSDIVPVPLPNPAAVSIDKLKIAAWSDDGVFPPSSAVSRAVREAAAMLRQSGAEVVELDAAEVQRHFSASEAFDLYCALIGADGGADARRMSRGSRLDPRVARLLWIARLAAAPARDGRRRLTAHRPAVDGPHRQPCPVRALPTLIGSSSSEKINSRRKC